MMINNRTAKGNVIGVFDSGIGGLSVLREIKKKLPGINLIYFGDQIHVPYGARPLNQVLEFSVSITEFLLSLGAELIVVACNTASAAALKDLRKLFPQIPFVGMEPAVKPAAEQSISGAVGVLATPATFQSQLYASVIERFAQGVHVYQDTCNGLVQEIEKGNFSGRKTRIILEKALHPMMLNHIDAVVLGCTHYPFVIPMIKEIVGPDIKVIDPAPAVARQVLNVFNQIQYHQKDVDAQSTAVITSGNVLKLVNGIKRFIPFEHNLYQAEWVEKSIKLKVTQAK